MIQSEHNRYTVLERKKLSLKYYLRTITSYSFNRGLERDSIKELVYRHMFFLYTVGVGVVYFFAPLYLQAPPQSHPVAMARGQPPPPAVRQPPPPAMQQPQQQAPRPQRPCESPLVYWLLLFTVLPKHTLFKVLYFILAKCKNYTLFILFFSQIL